jgi:hypothetical protein
MAVGVAVAEAACITVRQEMGAIAMASVPPRADTDHERTAAGDSGAAPDVPRKLYPEGSRRDRTPVLLTVLAAAIVVALILIL